MQALCSTVIFLNIFTDRYMAASMTRHQNLQMKTVFEQTFDAVQIDRRRDRIHLTRVGGGGDRTVHLKVRRAAAGAECVFKSTRLSGRVTWGVYDAGRLSSRPDPENRYGRLYTYHDDIASISPEGVVTAKKPGESVVVAMDGGGDKELFALRVS